MNFTGLVDGLMSSTKLTDKSRVLWKYLHDGVHSDYHRYLIQEAFDPKKLHNVTLTKKNIPPSGNRTLEEIQSGLRVVFDFISQNQSSKENKEIIIEAMVMLKKADQLALLGVVNKKLRVGVGISTINKVVTDLIPVIPIQLANKYDPKKHTTSPHNWYASPKLDGQRIFGIREVDGWKLYSRDKDYIGREITTLNHWKPELERVYEVCGADYTDGEAYLHGLKFEQIQSLVSSRVNIKNTKPLKYNLFTIGKGDLKSKELSLIPPPNITSLLGGMKMDYIEAVPQEQVVNTPDRIYEFLEKAVDQGYEGIMLRSTNPTEWYDFKRSDLLLKVKTSDTSGTEEVVDCYVEDMEFGDFVVREDGVESSEWLPIRLIVEFEGRQMKVGSGFSLQQRRDWREDETLIIGKTIEVMCQGFGAQGRMRYPRLSRIREDI